MDTFEAIYTRRSVRQYKDTPVSDDMLNKVLDAARWAPSWANTQCTRYVVVKDPDVKARLAETVNKGNPATEAIKQAPMVIVACAELGKSGYYRGAIVTDRGKSGSCLMSALPCRTWRWLRRRWGWGPCMSATYLIRKSR